MALVQGALRFARAVGANIPLFSRLGEVPAEERRQAFYETATTTIFATMPFWVLPALGFFIIRPRPELDEALQRGEGLIYAAALLGPLVYAITRRYGRFNLKFSDSGGRTSPLSMSFPYGGLFVTITALACAIAGFAFALQTALPADSGIEPGGVRLLSWVMMIGSTVIFYLITAYRNMLDGLEKRRADMVVEEQPRQETDFLGDWLKAKS